LALSANGFTFSSPVLKVKLTQEKPVEEQKPLDQIVQAPAASKVQSKKTIYCVKGKTTKKVTAVNPKCPTGYKKK